MSDETGAPEAIDVLDQLRDWLRDNWDPDLTVAQWWERLGVDGWAAPGLPANAYGRGLSRNDVVRVQQTIAEHGAVGAPAGLGLLLAAPTIATHGTQAQIDTFVRDIVTGQRAWCQLFSEPGAGSDLAGLTCRAERDGDQWIINGQKVWTSGAATADYGMLLARTDSDVPKHRGISFYFCPMKQPGIEIRPLRQITGEAHFNEVFITDAAVPAENLLGEENDGWRVLQTALAYERSAMGEQARGPRASLDGSEQSEGFGRTGSVDLIDLARRTGRLDDPTLRQDIASVLALQQLNALNTRRAKAALAQGTSSPIMSLGKLAMSRILHEGARVQTAILGADTLVEGTDYPDAENANFLTLNAFFTSIGGGTDQIQRNIIAERVLAMPKEPEVDREIPFREVRSGA